MALTGFLVNGYCAPDSGSAMLAYAADFPFVGGSTLQVVSFGGFTFTAPNSFNVTHYVKNLGAATNTNLVSIVKLPSCDPAVAPLGGTPFDPVVGGGFFMFALTFVLGSYLVANNMKMLLDAIKKF